MKLFIIMATALLALGCTSTKAAYKAAESPEEYAYVVSEHYNILVNEAADLAEQPGTPDSVRNALKEADAKAKPLVLALRGLVVNYRDVKSAENQAALQAALNKAVVAVASFSRLAHPKTVISGLTPALAGGVA